MLRPAITPAHSPPTEGVGSVATPGTWPGASASADSVVRPISATAPPPGGLDCFLEAPAPPGRGPWLAGPTLFEDSEPVRLHLDPARLLKSAVLAAGLALPAAAGAPRQYPSEEARLLAKLQLHDQTMAALQGPAPPPAPTPASLPELGIRALEHGVEYQLGPAGRLRLQDALDIRVDPNNPAGLIVRSGDVQVALAPRGGGPGWSVGRVDPQQTAWADWGEKTAFTALGALSAVLIALWAGRRWKEVESGRELAAD